MTSTDHTASLRTLGDDNLTTVDPAMDIRGRKVLDNAGKNIGHIDDLLVDDREHKVRFMRVAAGGFLGLGAAKFLIPVDAITRVDDTFVQVDQTQEHVASGPRYDPELMNERHLIDVYSHYGYGGNGPWWGAGYMYPAVFPRSEPEAANPPEADDGVPGELGPTVGLSGKVR